MPRFRISFKMDTVLLAFAKTLSSSSQIQAILDLILFHAKSFSPYQQISSLPTDEQKHLQIRAKVDKRAD